MKNIKKKGALFISLLLILSSSLIYIQTTRADTTIGDTSYGVNVGDVLTWDCY